MVEDGTEVCTKSPAPALVEALNLFSEDCPVVGNPRTTFLGAHMSNFRELCGRVGFFIGPTVGLTQVHARHNSKRIVQATLEAGGIRHLDPFLGMVQDFRCRPPYVD